MRTLMVASAGGHLSELRALRDRLVQPEDELTWVTFASPQAASLLAGEHVIHVPDVAPRDYRALLSSVAPARRILARTGAERVISTGAALALAFLPQARMRGLSCHYIESAARAEGPSVTGRLLQALHGACLYTQQPSWSRPPWHYGGSVFDGTVAVPRTQPRPLRRVLVTLGTSAFDFSRLVRRVEEVLPAEADVIWQTGSTGTRPLTGEVRPSMSHEQLVAEMAAADVVIAHAGVGTALTALSVGHCPVLVPRRVAHGEHVDDHQRQIAAALAERGLGIPAEADELQLTDLRRATATATAAAEGAPPFELHNDCARRRDRVSR